jgi:4-hydroxybenzoate polyprenyltransferase
MKKLIIWARLIRPSQQIKNGAVVLGALASGNLKDLGNITRLSFLVLSWIALSGSIYILNDVSDFEKDSKHPKKSLRPIASKEIQAKHAMLAVAPLLTVSLAISMNLGASVLGTTVLYLLINLLYSWKLKHFVIIDLLAVSSGFVLRGLSGVLVVSAQPSVWFILLSVFGSLLLVSGKRNAQKIDIIENENSQRGTIAEYSSQFLIQIQTICGAGLIMSYVLMAQEKIIDSRIQKIMLELSIIPFLTIILFILYFQSRENESDVTKLLISKNELRIASLVWFAVFTSSLV